MFTESHRGRSAVLLAAAVVALAVPLSSCSSGGSSRVTPTSVPSTPSASPTAPPAVSEAQLQAVGQQLDALNVDPALKAAAQASKDLRKLREIKADADTLTTQTTALKTNGCAQAKTISTSAAALATQSSQLLTAIPRELTSVSATITPLTTKTRALQGTIAQLMTKLGPTGDPVTLGRLQSYAGAASLLGTNVQGAQASVRDIPAQLPKVNQVGVELSNVQLNVAKRCG